MRYTITFYEKEDYDDVKNLILASYQWESSVVGNARLLFCEAMTTEFNHYEYAWEHTVVFPESKHKYDLLYILFKT